MALIDHKVSSLYRPRKEKRYSYEVDNTQYRYQPDDHILCYPIFYHIKELGQIWKPDQYRPQYAQGQKEHCN